MDKGFSLANVSSTSTTQTPDGTGTDTLREITPTATDNAGASQAAATADDLSSPAAEVASGKRRKSITEAFTDGVTSLLQSKKHEKPVPKEKTHTPKPNPNYEVFRNNDKNAKPTLPLDRHRRFWFSHVITMTAVDQNEGSINLNGRFKFFWRIPTRVWKDKFTKEGDANQHLQFKTFTGEDVDKETVDQSGGINRFLAEDLRGEIFPFNPLRIFKQQDLTEIKGGWFSIKHSEVDTLDTLDLSDDAKARREVHGIDPDEAPMSLMQMQIECDIKFKHPFDTDMYPYDKQCVMLEHELRWYPSRTFFPKAEKGTFKGRWQPFPFPPGVIKSQEGPVGKDGKKAWRKELYKAFPGFTKADGMEPYASTQLPVQDQPAPRSAMRDLTMLPTMVEFSKKETYIIIRLQRNPIDFYFQVVIPMFIIVFAAMSSFLADGMDEEEPPPFVDKVGITLTSLLTIIGLRQVVTDMTPYTDNLTFGDKYVLFGTVINGLIVCVNVLDGSGYLHDNGRFISVWIMRASLLFIWVTSFVLLSLDLLIQKYEHFFERLVGVDDDRELTVGGSTTYQSTFISSKLLRVSRSWKDSIKRAEKAQDEYEWPEPARVRVSEDQKFKHQYCQDLNDDGRPEAFHPHPEKEAKAGLAKRVSRAIMRPKKKSSQAKKKLAGQ